MNKETFPLFDTVKLKLSNYSPDIARISFTDTQDNDVKIPDNVTLYDVTNQVTVPPLADSFFVTWVSSYVLKQNEQSLVRIFNRKQFIVEKIE